MWMMRVRQIGQISVNFLRRRVGKRYVVNVALESVDTSTYVRVVRVLTYCTLLGFLWRPLCCAPVAYENQGPPFLLRPGDMVIQPPEIRHRVLESSDGLEVVEIGCPADHVTIAVRLCL